MFKPFKKFNRLTSDSEKRPLCIKQLNRIRIIRDEQRMNPLQSYDLEALNVAEKYYTTELKMINNRLSNQTQGVLFN